MYNAYQPPSRPSKGRPNFDRFEQYLSEAIHGNKTNEEPTIKTTGKSKRALVSNSDDDYSVGEEMDIQIGQPGKQIGEEAVKNAIIPAMSEVDLFVDASKHQLAMEDKVITNEIDKEIDYDSSKTFTVAANRLTRVVPYKYDVTETEPPFYMPDFERATPGKIYYVESVVGKDKTSPPLTNGEDIAGIKKYNQKVETSSSTKPIFVQTFKGKTDVEGIPTSSKLKEPQNWVTQLVKEISVLNITVSVFYNSYVRYVPVDKRFQCEARVKGLLNGMLSKSDFRGTSATKAFTYDCFIDSWEEITGQISGLCFYLLNFQDFYKSLPFMPFADERDERTMLDDLQELKRGYEAIWQLKLAEILAAPKTMSIDQAKELVSKWKIDYPYENAVLRTQNRKLLREVAKYKDAGYTGTTERGKDGKFRKVGRTDEDDRKEKRALEQQWKSYVALYVYNKFREYRLISFCEKVAGYLGQNNEFRLLRVNISETIIDKLATKFVYSKIDDNDKDPLLKHRTLLPKYYTEEIGPYQTYLDLDTSDLPGLIDLLGSNMIRDGIKQTILFIQKCQKAGSQPGAALLQINDLIKDDDKDTHSMQEIRALFVEMVAAQITLIDEIQKKVATTEKQHLHRSEYLSRLKLQMRKLLHDAGYGVALTYYQEVDGGGFGSLNLWS